MGIFNCDWLSFTADFENYNAAAGADRKDTFDPEQNKHLARLFSQLDEQREKPEGGYIDLGMWNFEVLNHGSRSYYYLLHNEDLEIRLARYRSKSEDVYPVYVHFKSQFLWAEIYNVKLLIDKYHLVIEWLQDVLNGRYLGSKINRIDLAYHTDDVPLGFNAEYFVGRHTLDTTRRTHRVVSGIDIGSRKSQKLFLRCYNKYLEARATKKSWFYAIWEHAGLNIRKVWNIEFQINREFFGDMKIGKIRLDTAEEIIERMPALWTYLTGEWITYREPDNERRTRWSLHPWWISLAGQFAECDDKISRGKQKELPTSEMLIPGIRGYLTSYAARKGGSLDDGTLFADLYQEILDYEEKSDKEWIKTVEIKKNLMDPEGLLSDMYPEITGAVNDLNQLEQEHYKLYRTRQTEVKPSLYRTLQEQERLIMDMKKEDAGTSPQKDPEK